MPPLPDADPAPADGRLPDRALADLGRRPFGVYLHVPFCATRCGYCDFTTYTPGEVSGLGPGAGPASYLDAVDAELALARRVLGDAAPAADTVFVGGGTPTLLGPAGIARLLASVRRHLGVAADAEVTTEANPESVDAAALAELAAAGVTRVSFGMQSVVPHVLATLDRRHTPGRPQQCVTEARAAGLATSLDLIYGTPGESAGDWRRSLDAAAEASPDHVSAYALTVEPGTALHRRVTRGELAGPDPDAQADAYLLAEEVLTAAGYGWYEVSSWARSAADRCRHNVGYWAGGDWWGAGPGAHSHVGGVRWWNGRHPARYADALAAGRSPAVGREVLDDADRRLERVMLELRLVGGLPLDALSDVGRKAAEAHAHEGLLEVAALASGRAVLTVRGRLLADAVVRDLTD